MYKTASLTFILLLYVFPFAVPVLGQDEEPTPTIAEIAADNENFTTLFAALDAAGLVGVLDGEGPFTVFAPTNEAFEALPEGELEALLQPENRETLTQIMMYHVVEGNAMAADVVGTNEVTTLLGLAVTINVDGNTIRLGDRAQVVQTDIQSSNGVIHVIDAVLFPPVGDGPPSDPKPSLKQVSDDLRDFAQTLELPLSLESTELLGQTSEANIEYWASNFVDAIPMFLYAEGQYDVVPFREYVSAEDRRVFALQLMSGEGFQEVGWEQPPLEVGDYIARADWRVESPQDQGGTEFTYLFVVNESGVKFDPVRWLTVESVTSEEPVTSESDLERKVFWRGKLTSGYGNDVVHWEFSIQFIGVDGCEMRAISVNKRVAAPGAIWSAEGATGYSMFCMEKPGCNCNCGNNEIDHLEDHRTCVAAEAAIGVGAGIPDISISSGTVGVTVGGMANASYEKTVTYRVCADGQAPVTTD